MIGKTLFRHFALLGLAVTAAAGLHAPAHASGERFVIISHAPDSDSWWNTIKNAEKLAAEQMDVTVDYRNPATGDLADMARIVQQTTAANPDGIVVTIADFDVLKGPIEEAVRKGIPVITINSGTLEESKALGALMHIGQPEYDAGLKAGERAKAAGVTNFVCVNHYITNPASVDRCRGFADGLGIELGDNMIDTGIDPNSVQTKVSAYLRAHPDTEAILALGPNSADPTLDVLQQSRQAGEIYFATFDLSQRISEGLKDGSVAFAIDQQPFLQGYLPIVFLANYARFGVIPSNDVVLSGPGFVTKDSIALVEQLAGEYR